VGWVRNAHAVADVRAAEQELMARLPEGALMQRAAAGLAAVCADLLDPVYGSRVVVLAGSGDNGGDALYAGARLARRGAVVTALTAGSRAHEGGAAELRAAGGRLIPAAAGGQAEAGGLSAAARELVGQADLVMDGILGIGGRGGLREPAAALAAAAAAGPGLVVAVDLPSGIDAGTGEVAGAAVRADVTVTFGTWKPGLLIDPAASLAGAAELIDIGLGPCLRPPAVTALQAADVAGMLPRPGAESDKYRRGVLGVVAGSTRFTGAATLAVGGALRGGAGMIRLVSAAHAAEIARQHWPEAVITVVGRDADPAGGLAGAGLAGAGAVPPDSAVAAAGQVQAWAAGPGMGTDDDAAVLLASVLATDLPVLVDADGLTVAARDRGLLRRDAPTLITPHAGELARLLGTDRDAVEARRLAHVRQAAGELGATVLLKGSTTLIASPDGRPVLVNATGTSWLATAGSGDVLSGLAGALLAQGLTPAQAGAAGAYLHGLAGRLAAAGAGGDQDSAHQIAGGAPIGAADLITALPAAIRRTAAGSAES
jgi:ADP-dependent NAD(P)H-hydrate dehydratase / NAD(P)H-hydrate epimerase